MRKCIIVRGAPGSGKSTFIESNDWKPYSLSMDDIRLLRHAPAMDQFGNISIIQEKNDSVYSEFLSRIESRAELGEFLVLEGVFKDQENKILDILKKYAYKVAVVDFSTMPITDIIQRNNSRPEYKRVNDQAVLKVHESLQNKNQWPVNSWIQWTADGSWKKLVENFTKVELNNWSNYKSVCLIGDLQGCKTVLTGPGGPIENGFDDEVMYVFVGDLLDRGIENGMLLRWFVDEAVKRDNVSLIWGNHEDHLYKYAIGARQVSPEFEKLTMPDLEKFGITQKEAMSVCAKAEEAIFFSYNNHKVMVTHAGLPSVPKNPLLISTKQYYKGTGYWTDPVDQQFDKNAPPDWEQVHGHRNHGFQPIQASKRSFSLEDQVEFGGRLRWVELDKDGWHPKSNKNTIFDLTSSKKIRKNSYKWGVDGTKVSETSLQGLRTHNGVKERIQENHPNISSFNFKKDVFFSSSWDDVTIRARGFFVNQQTREIVARGYDKFFNIGELESTSIDRIAADFKFPVTMYVKENGFLGNLGYDDETGNLFVASKSSDSGQFAQWFKDILDETVSEEKQDGIARWLRDNQACMTFEVIDPVNDPHMIEYKKSKIVLLDIFHRNEFTERVSYDTLAEVADRFGMNFKKRAMVFEHPDAFKGWLSHVDGKISWMLKGEPIEGFVIEDSQGRMTKFKTANYAFWKHIRSQRDRLFKTWSSMLTSGDSNHSLDVLRSDYHEKLKTSTAHNAVKSVMAWLVEQDPSLWEKPVPEIRNKFMATGPDPSIWKDDFTFESMVKIKFKPAKP